MSDQDNVLMQDSPIARARPPLDKKKLAAIVVILAIALMAIPLLWRGGSTSEKPSPVVAEPTKVGKVKSLEEEEADARKNMVERPPLPAAMPEAPVPVAASLPQKDNSAEMERLAKIHSSHVTLLDASSPNDGKPVTGFQMPTFGRTTTAGVEGLPAGTSNTGAGGGSAGVTQQLMQQLAQQQQKGGAMNTSWTAQYADALSTKKGSEIAEYRTAGNGLILHQGKVIPAVLTRRINSDMPGRVTAMVRQDVYDSLGNGTLLIPKGSTLDGQYNSDVRTGQSRVLFAFERLVLPDGRAFDLPAATGADQAGAAGISGDVDSHFFQMFGSALLIAILSNELTPTSNNSGVSISSGGPTDAAGQVLVDVTKQILGRSTDIKPTITVDEGTPINVDVVRDMRFGQPYQWK